MGDQSRSERENSLFLFRPRWMALGTVQRRTPRTPGSPARRLTPIIQTLFIEYLRRACFVVFTQRAVKRSHLLCLTPYKGQLDGSSGDA